MLGRVSTPRPNASLLGKDEARVVVFLLNTVKLFKPVLHLTCKMKFGQAWQQGACSQQQQSAAISCLDWRGSSGGAASG